MVKVRHYDGQESAQGVMVPKFTTDEHPEAGSIEFGDRGELGIYKDGTLIGGYAEGEWASFTVESSNGSTAS